VTASFKALTINIWNRQGPWARRCELLRQGIGRLAPDVVGLQEVIHGPRASQLDELDLGLEQAFGEAIDRGDGTSYGNAILSRHPIGRRRVFPLPGAELDEPRSVLLAEVFLPHGRLPVLVTHFAYRLEHGFVREQQAAALLDIVERQVPRGAGVLPALVMGDFNAGPETAEIQLLVSRLTDAYAQVGEPPGHTFDGDRNAFAAPWNEPPRRIDFVLVEPGATPVAARVVLDAIEDGVAPSDHYGVLATFE
jgi:endonuclease/exonuclease/phosphatase family metal-dependent hydrolase